MNALQKKLISVLLLCVLLIIGAVTVKQNHTNGEESSSAAESEQPAVGAKETAEQEAYQRADAELIFWYDDKTYTPYFEAAAKSYFDKTGIKVAVQCQDTIDYMGDIYDKTMKDEAFPDVYLISGDNLEEAYLYGLVSVNGKGVPEGISENAVTASTYGEWLLGYPLSFDTCVFVFQTDYFGNAPQSLQSIIDYSNENEPADDVKYLLEWDVNDPFYDFLFVSSGVSFEKTPGESLKVVYNEELYQQNLAYFEGILASFSVDAANVSEESIVENFLSGRTLSAIIDTDSLYKLEGHDYAVMKMPNLNETLPTTSCAVTDMLVVNDFSDKGDLASDFAEYVTVELADKLYDMTGHYSVIPSEQPEWTEQVAHAVYDTAVLMPDSQDAKDFWVSLQETILKYF